MSMNVSTTTAAYANYQNNYKTGTANKKKETAQTTENTKLKENTTESIAEKNLSKAAQKMLENLRGSRNDMDFMVADFENGDNAKDILAQSDKEYTVIFSKEEMEKMASDPKYYAEKMHSIEGVLRMTDEINAQFGFERCSIRQKSHRNWALWQTPARSSVWSRHGSRCSWHWKHWTQGNCWTR